MNKRFIYPSGYTFILWCLLASCVAVCLLYGMFSDFERYLSVDTILFGPIGTFLFIVLAYFTDSNLIVCTRDVAFVYGLSTAYQVPVEGIPAKVYEYVVNGRSALEWIIDRYQIRTDKDSGITNDPNDWGREHGNPRYIVDLIQSVTTVSVKTVDLVKKLEGVRLREQNSEQDLQAGISAANPVRNPEVLREIGEALKFREYLPVYSFKAACGPLAEGQEAEIEGWIKIEGHGKLDPTQFVVRTEGVSMEGLIPEGAMCIMRELGGGGLEGKTILVQRNDASDPETGGAYTIKTFTRKGKKVVLKAKDPKSDILLKDDAEYSQKYRAIAEFKKVIGRASSD